MQAGDLVVVTTIDKPGRVEYVRGGWVGVALVNEGGRVDEWPAAVVRPVTSKEAAAAAVRCLPARKPHDPGKESDLPENLRPW